jgi:bifunctional ADP-heptose synthase (sugar kinase/adenylyltransferase)
MIKFLVVGDSCTDVHIYGKCLRLSPEAPVPILNPIKVVKNGGMAKNVMANLKTMGAEVKIITNLNNIKKTRYVDEHTNAMLLRIDEYDFTDSIDSDELKKVKNNLYNDYEFDGLIISDYCKGFLNEEDIEYLINNNSNVFLDTKKILGIWMHGVDFIKINNIEYGRTKKYISKNKLDGKLIITKGPDGCEYKNKNYPVSKVDGIKDYSGAGDTFLAGFTFKYLETQDIELAIKYAQECATIVVQKHGVATI